MRPSSADTSEPACTKRKMLSMKKRTSCPSSRNFSAIVSPESATRRRAPGGPGEHREAAVLLGEVVDQLLDEDGLADAGAAEEADLAALDVRGEQVDDLDPGLEDLDLRRQVLEGRRVAVDPPALADLRL